MRKLWPVLTIIALLLAAVPLVTGQTGRVIIGAGGANSIVDLVADGKTIARFTPDGPASTFFGPATAASGITAPITGNVSGSAGSVAQSGITGGAWTAVPFNAANFTGNDAMTWTVEAGDAPASAYTTIGTTMVLTLGVDSTTVGGTPSSVLRYAIPASKACARFVSVPILTAQASWETGLAVCSVNDTYIRLYQGVVGSNWDARTNNTSIRMTIVFETK